jgi:[ribosomal protein S18]-alanine N-acetyltransferase
MSIVATAGVADAPILADLHAQSFAPAWDVSAFRDLLAGPGTFALAAPASAPWQAFILARAAAGEAEILTLAIVPGARRRGYARALVMAAAAEAAQRAAAEIFLEVAADNIAAIALYSALGFVPVGRRAGYYVRGPGAADALTLRAALPLLPARGGGQRGIGALS